jgi:hypothetical protein
VIPPDEPLPEAGKGSPAGPPEPDPTASFEPIVAQPDPGPSAPAGGPPPDPPAPPEAPAAGSAPWANPASPGAVPRESVRARDLLGRGFDLNVAAAGDVRRIAVLIGLLVLAAMGPYAAIFLALVSHVGGFAVALGAALPDHDIAPISPGVEAVFNLVTLIGVGCVVALVIDSQLLAVTVIASRAVGRAFVLRNGLELARMRFWRLLRANVIIFVILFLPRLLIERTIAPFGVETESQFVAITIVGVVLSIPFAYVSTWILLGPVGSRESIRRSWRLARSRLILATLIAVINILFQTIALFAVDAALEVVVRITDAIHLADATGLALFVPVGVIVALLIVAAGSLLPTIAALTAAPQVVAFLGMTGIANGLTVLDDPDNPFATPRVEPLVSRPMKIALAIELVLALYAISQIL